MILSVFYTVNIQLARKPCSIRPEPLLNSSGIDAQSRRFRCAIRTAYADNFIENQPVSVPSFDVNSDTMLTLQQELNAQDYDLLDQYCFQHKTVQEISEETGLTPNHIHVRLFRIRNEIRKIIFPLFVILLFSQEI